MDAFQQHRCRLVVGIWRHQLAFEGALQDGLAQAFGTALSSLRPSFRFLNVGHLAFNGFEYPPLFR
jgi:hypothetical protein